MDGIDTSLRYEVDEDDFNLKNKCSFVFYDGINFSGSIINYNLQQEYINGDSYERLYDINDDKIIKVTIKFYDKELNVTYSCEKELNNEVIYKKISPSNVEIITKDEYKEYALKFINKNTVKRF